MSASRHARLWRALMWSYWDVLAYEHDGLAAETAGAEAICARHAHDLRAFLAAQGLTPEEEDAEIAAAVRAARLRFAADLEEERRGPSDTPELEALRPASQRSWRTRRGRRHEA